MNCATAIRFFSRVLAVCKWKSSLKPCVKTPLHVKATHEFDSNVSACGDAAGQHRHAAGSKREHGRFACIGRFGVRFDIDHRPADRHVSSPKEVWKANTGRRT